MEQRLLTTEDVAEYLRVDAVTVRKLVSRGQLVAYRIAGEFRFMREDVESYVKSQRIFGSGNPLKDPAFEKFTERARKVLVFSGEEARRYHHSEIDTEHLLLGIVAEGGGVAARALVESGITTEQIRSEVEALHPAGNGESSNELGMTPRAKKSIEMAVEEARRLDHHYLGTEHMLVGLLCVKDGLAEIALSKLGVTLDDIRDKVKHILAEQH
jgi:excisionase family DNA binding protein